MILDMILNIKTTMNTVVGIIFVILPYLCFGISVKLDRNRNRYCIKVSLSENMIFEGSYLASGESEDKTTVTVLQSLY